MVTNSLIHQITLGREGKNWGYSMGLPKLEGIVDGVTQNTYTLVFSPTGSGKTSLALYSYIYKPLMEHLHDDNFKVIYYSLEMSAELLFAKLLSIYIFETYGIELSTKELLSKKKDYVLSDDYYNIVKECMPWLHKVEKIITVYDKALNAETLYKSLSSELEKTGEFIEDNNRKIYVPKNEDQVTLVVIDHLSLVRRSGGRSLKEEMDLISAYLVTLRNRCKISPLVIMQANRNSSSMDRRKEGLNNLTINDTKDTGAPAQDAEVIVSLFNPYREHLSTYKGYDIKKIQSNFRVITVLKNRYGEADVEIGCAFYGRTGVFVELPKPTEIYDYDKYTNANWLLDQNLKDKPIIKDDETEDNDNETSNLTFTL
jgi:replicative DNA helicase